MKHNSEDLGFTQCLKRNPMACVHECKAQPGVITAFKYILNAEYCQKKRRSQNPRIYSDFLIRTPQYPCRICKLVTSLSFSCCLVNVTNRALELM